MIQRQRRLTLGEVHWPLIFVVAAIGALGVYNLHSAAAGQAGALYVSQLEWFGIGATLIAISLAVDYRITEVAAYPLYATVVTLLILVRVAGRTVMGARRWLVLGPVTFQPSELTKVAIIFCLARYFAARPRPEGYALSDLLRPLSPTRPLLALGVLAYGWQKPFLVDPIGEVARKVYAAVGDTPPPLDNRLWFRVLLAVLLGFGTALALLVIVRLQRASALLNPWPEGRRRKLILLTLGTAISAAALLVWAWRLPSMGDPIGAALAVLAELGAPEGALGAPSSSWWPRSILLLVTLSYGALVWVATLRSREPVLELWIAPADLLGVPALLVLAQPDLGTAGIIVLIGMSMILVAGVRLRSLALLTLMGAATSAFAWFGVLKDYQKLRILTFIDPEQDVRGAGWNAVQSLIAVGSGRWLGKGHRNGTQTQLSFLPEQHTDFAFSVWAEEEGFFGCATLLALYLVLALLALRIAAQARDSYGLMVATGATSLILWQAAINIGMVTGALPVVGITLPLFSYGGSSALVVLMCVGLLLNVSWRRR